MKSSQIGVVTGVNAGDIFQKRIRSSEINIGQIYKYTQHAPGVGEIANLKKIIVN